LFVSNDFINKEFQEYSLELRGCKVVGVGELWSAMIRRYKVLSPPTP